MADASMEAAKKQLAEEQEFTNRIKAEAAFRMRGKPTPTQEENDLAACGAHILEHEDDGSGPDPHQTKQLDPKKPSGGYQTRQSAPAQRPVHSSS